jgi:hypothetical protein
MSPDLLNGAWDLPVKTPPEGSTFEFIKASLQTEAKCPTLERALRSSAADPGRELEDIVRELFRRTSARWLALKLLERCAADWPALAELWFGNHRLRSKQMVRYLDSRMSAGNSARQTPRRRLILEMVAARDAAGGPLSGRRGSVGAEELSWTRSSRLRAARKKGMMNMNFRHFVPSLGFALPTLLIGYGIVIPQVVSRASAPSVGFGATVFGACLAYIAGIRTVWADRPASWEEEEMRRPEFLAPRPTAGGWFGRVLAKLMAWRQARRMTQHWISWRFVR